MTPRKRRAASHAGNTYRMSELVEASGVSRDMIKYYLRAGLLPPAQKPRANLSLYTDNHLNLIALVRRFQAQTKLSLPAIADVFRAAAYDANAVEIELLSAKHSVGDGDNIIPYENGWRDERGPSLPDHFLRQLEALSLLDQSDENRERLAALMWSAHRAGVPLTFFRDARRKLLELAELEVSALIAIKRPGLSFDETVVNVMEIDRIVNRWMITEKNGQIRRKFQQVIDNSERAVSTVLNTVYRPSELFRKRHRVEAALSKLIARAEAGKLDREQSSDLSFACLLLGHYHRAIELAQRLLADDPQDAMAIALMTLAHGLRDDADQAFDYGSRLRQSDLDHPAVAQARIVSLLLRAAKLRGVTDISELLKKAGEMFLEAPGEPTAEEPEAVLMLARGNVAFPDFANSRPQAIEALGALRQRIETDTAGPRGLEVEGLEETLRAVYRIYVLYFLGELHTMDGDTGAARDCFEKVIQLDPASNFGERAYLLLGDG